MIDIREIANPRTTKVFVNGNWVGVHRDPEELTGACAFCIIFGLFVYVCKHSRYFDVYVIMCLYTYTYMYMYMYRH
jgi:hypothetical protein